MIFAKAHGTGNDFVVLPDPQGLIDLSPELVAAICDRHLGIGGDGVLRVVRSAREPEAAAMAGQTEWFMDYRNSDGSCAEMCGNGVRAYARYLVESELVAPDTRHLSIGTRAGVVGVEIDPDVITVALDPITVGAPDTASVSGHRYPGTTADAGNPHLVCPVPDTAALAALDLTRAPDTDPGAFPNGVNVEFVAPGEPVAGADLHVHMRVFERGSGETLSCGSGACAVAAVALRGQGKDAGVVAVDVPGGRLTVTVGPDRCLLAGPAVVVATGKIDEDMLVRPA